IEQRVRWLRRNGDLAAVPLDDVLAQVRRFGAFVGTPDELIERLKAYATLGAQEIMLQWFDPEDMDGLRLLAEEIVPYV
ncbi:MAG TPA: hypothetical protein VER55_03055, partial [Ardenticatenaceae bacterium]|nr:hypothetical protein [Ardenticatenaceae bacterium]